MITDSVPDYASNRMTIELPHQIRSVRLGCLGLDSQNCPDFLVALALRQKLHDFSFPSRYLR